MESNPIESDTGSAKVQGLKWFCRMSAWGRQCGYASLRGKRLISGAVDGVAGFRRLVADNPSGGREFSDSIDGKVGQTGQHRAEIIANW
jgi:hypothetical protein